MMAMNKSPGQAPIELRLTGAALAINEACAEATAHAAGMGDAHAQLCAAVDALRRDGAPPPAPTARAQRTLLIAALTGALCAILTAYFGGLIG